MLLFRYIPVIPFWDLDASRDIALEMALCHQRFKSEQGSSQNPSRFKSEPCKVQSQNPSRFKVRTIPEPFKVQSQNHSRRSVSPPAKGPSCPPAKASSGTSWAGSFTSSIASQVDGTGEGSNLVRNFVGQWSTVNIRCVPFNSLTKMPLDPGKKSQTCTA